MEDISDSTDGPLDNSPMENYWRLERGQLDRINININQASTQYVILIEKIRVFLYISERIFH